jgi:uncharacterized protein (DUF433 family)
MMTLETTQTVPLTVTEGGTIRFTGSRISLDVVIHHYQQGESPEEILEAFPTLKLADIHAVISYYLNHREEVAEYLLRQEVKAGEMQRMIEDSPLHVDTTGMRERLQARWDAMQQTKADAPSD